MATRFSMEHYMLHDKSERDVDAAIEDTFPVDDPPSTGGPTGIGPDEDTRTQAGSDVPGTQPDEDVPDEDTPPEPSPGGPPEEMGPRGVTFK
jgi:hypothetical protein